MLIEPGGHASFFNKEGREVIFNPHDPESMRQYAEARGSAIEAFRDEVAAESVETDGVLDAEKVEHRKGMLATLNSMLETFNPFR